MGGAFSWIAHHLPGAETIANAYKGPANEQKSAYYNAGQASSNLGKEQRDWYMNQANTALGFYGGGNAPQAYGTGPAPTPSAHYSFATGNGETNGPNQLAGGQPNVLPKGAGKTFNGGPGGGGGGGAPTADDALRNQMRNPSMYQRNFYNQMTQPGARPTQQQTYFDYMQGQVGDPTNLESLYSERKAGGNQYEDYEDKRATDAINRAMAARGGFNSGNARRGITDYYANVGAQRDRDLASLAGAADASRLGLSNAYGGSASGASGEQRGYFSDVGDAARGASGEQSDYYKSLTSGAFDLSKAKADLYADFAARGGQAYSEGELANIEAKLAAAGVDAATIKAFMQDVKDIGKGVVSGGTELAKAA